MIGLVEAGLVTLPEQIQRTRKATLLSKRFGIPPKYILLDVSLFYEEMKKIGIDPRYARPDIVHQFLLASQYSPLNLEGKLRVFIHTAHNDLILIRPEARIPKNYYQFVGLMQRLFMNEQVPDKGEWLMKLRRKVSLDKALRELGVENPILMHENGEAITCNKAKGMTYPPRAFLIGGFPRGDFTQNTLRLVTEKYSIKKGVRLDAWIVADRLIACFEGDLS
jgi:rRNA small subunit pseudouridine methyltransferase Nep1